MAKHKSVSYLFPPLIETYIGAHFENNIGFQTLSLYDFWEKLGCDRFSSYSEHSPLDPLPKPNTHTFDFRTIPPMRRFWFEGGDDKEYLVQVQEDRFIYNWRKQQGKNIGSYPRYEKVRDAFFDYYSTFEDSLMKEVKKVPSHLELGYINLIEIPDQRIENVEQVFVGLSLEKCILKKSERTLSSGGIAYRSIFNIDKESRALTMDISVRQNPQTGKLYFYFELKVTGPFSGDIKDFEKIEMVEWFDGARKHISSAFQNMTTEKMQEQWGKQNENN